MYIVKKNVGSLYKTGNVAFINKRKTAKYNFLAQTSEPFREEFVITTYKFYLFVKYVSDLAGSVVLSVIFGFEFLVTLRLTNNSRWPIIETSRQFQDYQGQGTSARSVLNTGSHSSSWARRPTINAGCRGTVNGNLLVFLILDGTSMEPLIGMLYRMDTRDADRQPETRDQ